MINATATGRLVDEPELRLTVNGRVVTTIRLASANHDGTTSCIEVTLWGDAGTAAAEHLVRGQQVTIAGVLESREWTDPDGTGRTTWKLTAHASEWHRRHSPEPSPADLPRLADQSAR